MRFAVVFSIVAKHDYYEDGICRDVVFQATARTARVLRGHRWLTRLSAGKVTVVAEVDAAGRPLIELDPSERLQFRLGAGSGQFHLFTELGGFAPATVFVPSTADTGPVRALRPAEAPAPAAEPGTLAGVEIPAALLPALGEPRPEFQIQFVARRARWKYYCVTDLDLKGKELLIVDRDGSAAALRFGAANRTDLNQQPDPEDPVAVQLAEQFPLLTRIRFLSDDLVACRQAPRRRLELLLGANRFPDPLPNPALTNQSSVVVTSGGKTSQQPALYQVVTYVTQPLSEKGD